MPRHMLRSGKRRFPRKSSFKRRNPKGYPLVRGPKPITAFKFFPPTKYITSVYEAGGNLTVPVSETDIVTMVLRTCDWYDPNFLVGGEAPIDWAFYKQFYKYYTVIGVSWEIYGAPVSTSSQPSYFGCYISKASENPTSVPGSVVEPVKIPTAEAGWEHLLSDHTRIGEQKMIAGSDRTLGPGHKDVVHLSGYINNFKIDNLPMPDAVTNATLAAGDLPFTAKLNPDAVQSEAHPGASHYLVIYTRECPFASTPTAVAVSVKLRYYVRLDSPIFQFKHSTADDWDEAHGVIPDDGLVDGTTLEPHE